MNAMTFHWKECFTLRDGLEEMVRAGSEPAEMIRDLQKRFGDAPKDGGHQFEVSFSLEELGVMIRGGEAIDPCTELGEWVAPDLLTRLDAELASMQGGPSLN
ncbi:hypothetical protein ACEUZ9_000490 [Paracoccus litorisediminis]|uniref:hypothetical protein n=1 Tax=Paracoccus litorisediminis TaxID=2006130 RepID=UPI003731E6B3